MRFLLARPNVVMKRVHFRQDLRLFPKGGGALFSLNEM